MSMRISATIRGAICADPRQASAPLLHNKSIHAAFADSVEFYAEEGRISFR